MPTLSIDGDQHSFTAGDTLFEVAERIGKRVPSLCYDPRLESFGACRLCIVELEGVRNPVASCTTKAEPGQVVRTDTQALEQHRKVILELVVSENREVEVDPLRGYASQELADLLREHGVAPDRFAGSKSGTSKFDDPNPFILRDYELCISCYRCVRVCAEQEGDFAISIMNRGFSTQIVTEFDAVLAESACTFCGQCVQTCPTGALADKKALRAALLPEPIEKTRTICPYLRCRLRCRLAYQG